MHHLYLALWIFLPAALANGAPVIANVIPGLGRYNAPIDGGHSYRGKRIFGDHKTWRGLLAGMVMATLVLYLEQLAAGQWSWARTLVPGVNYATLPVFIVGPLMGFGALAGDAIESFFKRQLDHEPGSSWVPFDQLDYVVGGLAASQPWFQLSFVDLSSVLVVWFGLHFVGSWLGFRAGLKDRPL